MQGQAVIASSDVPRIVEAVFALGVPGVYEAYSAFDSEILSFPGPQELAAYIQERSVRESFLGFVLYFPDTRGFVEKERIRLDPKKCDGHTFRYRISGWGVIQFQLDFGKPKGVECRFAVNSEARANRWFGTYPEMKSPALWEWKLVEKHTRRLVRELKKYAQQGTPADVSVGAARRQSRG